MGSMLGKVYMNSKGVTVKYTTDIDLSDAIELRIYYAKPEDTDGNVTGGYWEAEVSGTSSMEYTTVTGDIDAYGLWRFQGWAKLSASEELYGDIVSFTIYQTIADSLGL